jgi:ABC-type nitrate/sulfonate/bicarbonate transport system substrate-binding protein
MRSAVLALAVALGIVLPGCGGTVVEVDSDASILLDFTPNAAHTGIYTAAARGYDPDVTLHVKVPGASTDGVRLLAAGKVDFAVLDIHDLALADAHGASLVGVMALVQRPLASVITQPGVRSPRALAGRTVGVTGVPSDDAVLRSEVRGDGGNPAAVTTTTIGFKAVQSLLTRRVDAATAFWDVEGVALRRRRPGFRVFKVDDYGAPAYPELVLCATRATVRDRRSLVDGVTAAIRRGYAQTLQDPESAVETMVERTGGLDRSLLQAELDAVQPAFQAPDGRIGELDPRRLRAWARWELRFGIVKHRPDVRRMFLLSR